MSVWPHLCGSLPCCTLAARRQIACDQYVDCISSACTWDWAGDLRMTCAAAVFSPGRGCCRLDWQHDCTIADAVCLDITNKCCVNALLRRDWWCGASTMYTGEFVRQSSLSTPGVHSSVGGMCSCYFLVTNTMSTVRVVAVLVASVHKLSVGNITSDLMTAWRFSNCADSRMYQH